MNPRNFLNKAIILSVFIIAGYLLARSLYYGSFIGILCALLAIAAWTFFLYRLSKMQTGNQQSDDEMKETY